MMFSHYGASLTYRNIQGDGFKLPAGVTEQLVSYVQSGLHQAEAGGVLLGRYIHECQDVVVDLVSLPRMGDLRSRLRFRRSRQGHQEVVNRAWLSSQGRCHYIGEWHTHPEADPCPSAVDWENWQRILVAHKDDPDPLYFVIVGTEFINVWQGYKANLEIEKLILIAREE